MAIGGLDTALSGLRVAQQQLDVISTNISNVNTPGYTRKVLPQQSRVIDGRSVGVYSNPAIRNVDLNLARDFWTQVSNVEFFNIQTQFLEKIQEFHGPPDLEVSIAAEISQLQDKFAALADSPEDTFLQRTTVEQAILVADKFNDLSGLLTRLRNDAQDEIALSVEEINKLLVEIADLNKQIKFNHIAGKTKSNLEDSRDEVVRKLSEHLDVTFFTRGDGVMVVQTARGVQLADERAEVVYFEKRPLGVASYYPNNVGGIYVGGNPANVTTAIEVTQTGLGGKIGGLLDLRDRILPQNQAMVDELAHKMAYRFDLQGLRLFTDASGNVPSDSSAHLIGSVDLPALAPGAPLSTAGGAPWIAGVTDTFTITLNANGVGPAPQSLSINLTAAEAAFPIPPSADGAQSLVSYINAQIATLPAAYANTAASLDANGQLNITSDYDVRISANAPGEMGNAGMTFLGLPTATEYAAPKANPLTPVPYTGFSSVIRVNASIVNDNRLVQQGTVPTDIPVQDGSNEVIRRVIEFVFNDVEYQQAVSTTDLRASGAATTLQQWLGVYSENRVTTTKNLTGFSTVATLMNSIDPPLVAATNDTFRLTFEEARLGLGPFDIDISLSAADLQPGATAADRIVAEINAQIAALPVDPYLTAVASVNAFGQIVIESRGNITINADPPAVPNPMLQRGLDLLGLTAGTYQTTDPYFDVQVGNDPPTRVTIAADDDETDLIAKLNKVLPMGPGVPGLGVDFHAATGILTLRPGDDVANPRFGGDFKITGGPFMADGAGLVGTVNAGDSLIRALFGSDTPIADVPYNSQTANGVNVAFRTSGLGPNGTLSTGIISSTTLIDYAQKMVNQQASELLTIEGKITDETAFRDLLQRRLQDESGVNIDEELSHMIIIQAAYAAAARVITAIDEQFQELLNAIR